MRRDAVRLLAFELAFGAEPVFEFAAAAAGDADLVGAPGDLVVADFAAAGLLRGGAAGDGGVAHGGAGAGGLGGGFRANFVSDPWIFVLFKLGHIEIPS
jgi:hypothetical protein